MEYQSLNGGDYARGTEAPLSIELNEIERLKEIEEYEERYYQEVLLPEARERMWNTLILIAFAILYVIASNN